MVFLEKGNNIWGVVNDEVGKVGKRWDEWGDRIVEDGVLMV